MPDRKWDRWRWPLAIVVWVTLASIGAVACTYVYRHALEGIRDDGQQRALFWAELTAMQLDPSFRAVRHTSSHHILSECLKRVPGARAVSLIAVEGNKIRSIESVNEAIALLNANRLPDRIARSVLSAKSRRAQNPWIESLLTGSNAKDVLFAPVNPETNPNSEFLMVEIGTPLSNRHAGKLNNQYIICIGLVALLTAAMSFLGIALRYPQRRSTPPWLKKARNKRLLAEMILVAAVGMFGLCGVLAQLASTADAERNFEQIRHMGDVSSYRSEMFRPVTRFVDSVGRGLVSPQRALSDRILSEEESLRDSSGKVLSQSAANGALLTQAMTILSAFAAVVILLAKAGSKQEHRMEDMAAESEFHRQAYDDLVEHLPIGVFAFREGRLVTSNAEWCNQHGITAGDYDQTSFATEIVAPDRQYVMEAISNAENQGIPFRVEYRVLCDDHCLRHIESRGIPVKGDDGKTKHVLAFSIDVTHINRAKLDLERKHSELVGKNELLGQALEELEGSLEWMARLLVRAVEAKDPYTAGHSDRVMQYATWTAEELGLSPFETRILELGALIHDIGKIGVPDHLLTKPGALTAVEREQIKLHSDNGSTMIEGIGLFRDCWPIVRWHHERMDGSGYPDGLEGLNIPFLVRLATVADIFDALTSTRAYRAGLSATDALNVIEKDVAAGRLDATAFESLRSVVNKHGVIPQQDLGNRDIAA